ncbi:MAG: ACP phosphodiesterase [Porticoccaceae bacterium]|nr:ACP phosphodiesterase [Porticoccaceae bacterium]MEA3298850.1 ACP phosphodiesterase [Pseudomonadota bacterium]HLS97517.1 ACP phosphodiesterase [Porticoccaceae bacterium]
MNYLAHLLLSGPDRDMQVGGLLGDFVKGPLRGELPARVEQGIRLHRHIDTLTDSHPSFMAATRRLPGEWRRYRGILLDIYFDHLLACRWDDYHAASLEEFCGCFYRHLARHREILPPRALHFSRVAPQVAWLESYRAGERLPTMLDNVGRRLSRPVPLGEAWPALEQDRPFLEQAFETLMADLLESARPHRQEP